jgi:hypothetical protein
MRTVKTRARIAPERSFGGANEPESAPSPDGETE